MNGVWRLARQNPRGLLRRQQAEANLEPAEPERGTLVPFPAVAAAPEPVQDVRAEATQRLLAEVAAVGPFIKMRAESGLRLQVDAAFERAGVARTVAFELGTSESVVRFVGLGFGAALVPLSATGTATGVSVLALSDRRARHPISLVHPETEPSTPSARAFLALLREHLPVSGT